MMIIKIQKMLIQIKCIEKEDLLAWLGNKMHQPFLSQAVECLVSILKEVGVSFFGSLQSLILDGLLRSF